MFRDYDEEQEVKVLLVENRPAHRDSLQMTLEKKLYRNLRFKVITPDCFVEQQEGGSYTSEEQATEEIFKTIHQNADIRIVAVDLGLPPRPNDPDIGLRLVSNLLNRSGLGTSFKIVAYSNQANLEPKAVAKFVRQQVSYMAFPVGMVDMYDFPLVLAMTYAGYFVFSPHAAPLLRNILNAPPDPLGTEDWELLYAIATRPDLSYEKLQEQLGWQGDNVIALKANAIMDKLDQVKNPPRTRARVALQEWWQENNYIYAREDTKPKGF